MQQHLMQMQPMMAAYYPSNVTTDHIQQVLSSSPFFAIHDSTIFMYFCIEIHCHIFVFVGL